MSIYPVSEKDRKQFNNLTSHPLQSWEWGEFREKTGIKVIRLGKYEKDLLVEVVQITIHKIPFLNLNIGYIPKSQIPSKEMMEELIITGRKNRCIFIKLEPNIIQNDSKFQIPNSKLQIVKSPHPLFTKYTFTLDLSKSEETLLKSMHGKTRYNIKVAEKHGVKIRENNSPDAFEQYLKLTEETARRQEFFAHNRKYHTEMWEHLHTSGIAHLFTAEYIDDKKSKILTAWILFLFNKVLYYPYGASSNLHRNVMASNLMMWETIKWGKKMGAVSYDLWGSLGPNADPKDPWYGFHKFKQGYGTTLIEFVGSFDLIINPIQYKLYNTAFFIRSFLLKIKAKLRDKLNRSAL
jgi:lipid II:glycine glycyltransferase (peptidoglycan interpeptide bridge formation enzyme)